MLMANGQAHLATGLHTEQQIPDVKRSNTAASAAPEWQGRRKGRRGGGGGGGGQEQGWWEGQKGP